MKIPSFLWWLPIGKVPEIEPQKFNDWLNQKHPVQIVDARTLIEFKSGTIGDAIHAPLVEMPRSMERLTLDPGIPVVVLCLSGHRSIPGTRWLHQRGYTAYSLQGGIMNWKRQGYSTDEKR